MTHPATLVILSLFQESFKKRFRRQVIFESSHKTRLSLPSVTSLLFSSTPPAAAAKEPAVVGLDALPMEKKDGIITLQVEACQIVKSILEGTEKRFVLLPFSEVAFGKKRADLYQYYHVITPIGTLANSVWMVCDYVKHELCDLSSGIRKYCPKIGTSHLIMHIKIHKYHEASSVTKVPRDVKDYIMNSAALACVVHNLPYTFCQNKPAIIQFCRTLVKIGQRYPVSIAVDVKDVLPSAKRVRNKVRELAAQKRERFTKNDLSKIR